MYQGSCLCGAVQFEIKGEFEHFYLCHCTYCRKDTGTAHAANLFSTTASLSWLSGEDSVRLFKLEGTRHSKCFCQNCGSALPVQENNSEIIMVPAGSLDSDIKLKPNAHIFTESKASWDENLNSIKGFKAFPQ